MTRNEFSNSFGLADVEDWDLVVNVTLGQNEFKVYQKKKKKKSTLM